MEAEDITRAVEQTAADYLSRPSYASLADINAGGCNGFANDVYARLGGYLTCSALGLREFGIEAFLVPPDEEDMVDGNPFDIALIEKHWPNVTPPDGFDWTMLDQLSADAGFNEGTHVFLEFQGRFYDAEAPEGVDNFLELPFFVRVRESWLVERHLPSLAVSP